MSWNRQCVELVGCSPEERAVIEARVAENPNDVEARLRLVGALWLPVDEAHQQARGEQLIWLATHHPEIGLGSFGQLIEDYAPKQREALHAVWRKAVEDPNVDLNILANAASCLGSPRPEDAEPLHRRAVARHPGNYVWRDRLAWCLLLQERPLEAITELEAALERADDDATSLVLCLKLLDAVVMSKQWGWVAELAPRILADNEALGPGWNFGNALHEAYVALGKAAHARGKVAEASFYLLESAKTPGSPQLNSFGPDRELAKALFESGARDAVRAYFNECRRFWPRADEALAALP